MVTALDLDFLGRPGAIAAGLLEGPRGLALVDPGPASCLDGLRAALARHGHRLEDVDTILVTHIHLDHSGGVGVLVAVEPSPPGLRAQARGAARRGSVEARVEREPAVRRAHGAGCGARFCPCRRRTCTRSTAGKCCRWRASRSAWPTRPATRRTTSATSRRRAARRSPGDTGGIRVGQPLLVLPPTPPPDIDVEAWDASLALIRAWQPQRVFITHFGGFDEPLDHLADLEERLHDMAATVRALLLDERLDDGQRRATVRRLGWWRCSANACPTKTGCSATTRPFPWTTAGRGSRGTGGSGCRAGLARPGPGTGQGGCRVDHPAGYSPISVQQLAAPVAPPRAGRRCCAGRPVRGRGPRRPARRTVPSSARGASPERARVANHRQPAASTERVSRLEPGLPKRVAKFRRLVVGGSSDDLAARGVDDAHHQPRPFPRLARRLGDRPGRKHDGIHRRKSGEADQRTFVLDVGDERARARRRTWTARRWACARPARRPARADGRPWRRIAPVRASPRS